MGQGVLRSRCRAWVRAPGNTRAAQTEGPTVSSIDYELDPAGRHQSPTMRCPSLPLLFRSEPPGSLNAACSSCSCSSCSCCRSCCSDPGSPAGHAWPSSQLPRDHLSCRESTGSAHIRGILTGTVSSQACRPHLTAKCFEDSSLASTPK